MKEVKQLYSDENFSLMTINGKDADMCFVSFTGFEHVHGQNHNDFIGSIAKRGCGMFVHDHKKSWGTFIDDSLLADKVHKFANGKRIFLIGTSMGATSALYFSKVINCDVVISFGAQYSLDHNIVRTDNWLSPEVFERSKEISSVAKFQNIEFIKDNKNISYYIFHGANDEFDIAHSAHFPTSGENINRYRIEDSRHVVSDYFKRNGLLDDLFLFLPDRKTKDFENSMKRQNVRFTKI